jgi:hypothetical protein
MGTTVSPCKEAVKSFVKSACKKMSAAEVKEIETALVAIRNDRVKQEKSEVGRAIGCFGHALT